MRLRRFLGAPLSWLFGAIVLVRRQVYDQGWLPSRRAAVPVISVGNIAVGGTGKTPLVEWMSQLLQRHGVRVGILSRGYGRRSTGFRLVSGGSGGSTDPDLVGDEPAQMSQRLTSSGQLPGVVIAVDEDRAHGAEWLFREYGVSVIVLDDGFQHRRLRRDLDVVLMTSKELLEGDALLPAGNWREPLSAVQRAGVVIITRCESVEMFEAARQRLPMSKAIVVGARTRVRAVRRAATLSDVELGALRSEKTFLLSGIGEPESFHRTASELGMMIVGAAAFSDHHRFSDAELDRVELEFRRSGATVLLTTEKDAVRLRSPRAQRFVKELPLHIVSIYQEFITDSGELESAILSAAHAR